MRKDNKVALNINKKRYYTVVVTDDPDFLNKVVKDYELSRNYPNPFNPSTKISFAIPTPFTEQGRPIYDKQRVTLKIYDMRGRLIKTLTDSKYKPGKRYQKRWMGKGNTGRLVSSGVYVYRVDIGGRFVKSRKMVIVK